MTGKSEVAVALGENRAYSARTFAVFSAFEQRFLAILGLPRFAGPA